MQAAVAMAFAYLIDADIAKNTGALRPPGPIPAGAALSLTPRSTVLLRVAS